MLSDYYKNSNLSPEQKLYEQKKKLYQKFKKENILDEQQMESDLKKVIDKSLEKVLKDFQ